MAMVLFFKGGVGSGNPDHHGRIGYVGGSLPRGTTLPDSSNISDLLAAKAYWDTHFGGKSRELTVHANKRSKPDIKIKVNFELKNDHAYTFGEADEFGRKTGKRVFSKERAAQMWRLLSAIEYPNHILESRDGELFFERIADGQHYCIVLKHHSKSNAYDFASAHFYTSKELLVARDRLKSTQAKGEIAKSLPGSTDRGFYSRSQVCDRYTARRPSCLQSGANYDDPLSPLVKASDPASTGCGFELTVSGLLMHIKALHG